MNDVRPIADAEGLLHVVVGDQHRDPLVGETTDLGLQLLDGVGVDGREGFVQEHQPRTSHEGAGDLEAASLSAGAGSCELLALVDEPELLQKLVAASLSSVAVQAAGLENGEDVLFDGQFLEDAGFLAEVPHAVLGVAVHRLGGQVPIIEDDLPLLGGEHPDGHPEGSGLPGSVAAEEADDLAGIDLESDPVDDLPATVALLQIPDFEQCHAPIVSDLGSGLPSGACSATTSTLPDDRSSSFEAISGACRAGRIVLMGLIMGGLLVGGGCVRRVVEITSEPSGAVVWMNDREVGSTPCEVEILHYGTYDLRVVKPGYEPAVTGRRAAPPAWDLPGPDLIAELLPMELESRNSWHVKLVIEDMSTDAVIQRAIIERDRLAALDRRDPIDPEAGIEEGLVEKVERADGLRPVEPGQPVQGAVQPVEPDPVAEPGVPGLDPGSDPGRDPDMPAGSSEDE